VKLFGGDVSRDKDFIEEVAMKRVVRVVELMHLLPKLRDPQSERLLLWSCMGIAKLFFCLRTCQPIYMEEAVVLVDEEFRAAVENIVVGVVRSFETFNGGLLLYPLSLWG
jgi:hypothetical protein